MKKDNEIFDQKTQHLSQENQKLNQELSNLKEKQIDSGIQSTIQQIFNACPIMDHKNKENFLKKFEIIGPVNIQDLITNSKIDISFDPNQISIAFI